LQLSQLLDAADGAAMDFETGILPLENLSDQLHRVWAPVSHLHAVTNSPALRTAYNNCLTVLARYETEIAQDERLYRLYENVARTLSEDRTDGAGHLVRHALRGFKLSGVSLPADEKLRFKAIAENLSQLQAKFEQNVLDSMAAWYHHETEIESVAGIPTSVLEQAASNARDESLDGWLFRLDQPTYIAVITHAENQNLRFRFYRAWVTRASPEMPNGTEFDNTGVIEEILRLRHELAGLVGYSNYSDYSLASKMADSVAEVQAFLQDLADQSHQTAVDELEALTRFAGKPLAAWDIAFFSEQLRLQNYSVSDEQLRPYFPVDSVLNGLFDVVGKLYGLKVALIEDVETWQTDVKYFSLIDEGGETIGGVFVDLFARPNKRSGAWMDECVIRKNIDRNLQNPVAHLVCNFAGPTESAPCLLSHDDVVTLFHEFGHTLHHLLTRVDYPSVSGINGVPWDAVELPSQFMENFAWQPEVVTMLSSHYQTGEPLPEELLDKLRASRIFQAGLKMLRQLEFSLFDLRLHAEYDPAIGSNSASLLDEIHSQIGVVEQPDFNRFANSFSHIFGGGYAAGYYSYKWAEVLAADAWSAFEDEGIFSTDLARKFRQKILEIGGTEKISDAFMAFRGRPPQIQPLLRQAGIAENESA
jgi:oligopeptidase A